MNLPTIIVGLIILLAVGAIIGKGIYNRLHHKGGCSCGCGDCPSRGLCHGVREYGSLSEESLAKTFTRQGTRQHRLTRLLRR